MQTNIVRVNKPPITEPKAVTKEVLETGTKLNEAEIAEPMKVKFKNPMKSALLFPHETVNSKKRIKSVTFADLNSRGSTNVRKDKAGKKFR